MATRTNNHSRVSKKPEPKPPCRERVRLDEDDKRQQKVDRAKSRPPIFLRPQEAADLLRMSVPSLARWRCQGTGPVYRKCGSRVVYAEKDLLEWADKQIRKSTSEL